MSVRILHGDCREVLRTLADASMDSCVTDPPYELGFMGQGWDSTGVTNDAAVWAEVLRVLKPGGYLLAFSGTRTYHRMVCAIEDAGFEIRDQIGWAFGSGFPKSLDVSKAIDAAAGAERKLTRDGVVQRDGYGGDWDTGSSSRPRRDEPATDAARQWAGWGTALKPAWEPICMARKPLIGTVAANVLAHGTGGLNIDGCRVPTTDDLNGGAYSGGGKDPANASSYATGTHAGEFVQPPGRWPANLIHDGSAEVLAAFPQAPGQQADASATAPSARTSNVYGAMRRDGEASADSDNEGAVGFKMKPGARRLDTGSAARFFYCAKADRADRNAGMEGMPEKPLLWSSGEQSPGTFQSANTKRAAQNNHPTVKPTDLMRYLCRLVTPAGGVVLDPFMGSGSTLKAAELEGFDAIGIELSADYIEIARSRIASDAPLFAEVA